MATIYVDGKAYQVQDGQNLLHAVLSAGINLEYFCWHPALNSVGACRQCAVIQYKDEEAEKAGKGKLIMACMTPATDGTRISVKALEAVAFRRSVTEWLMVNHPHDCPICDEGGACHLQDMTVMTGHNYREYRFQKRTHRNQYLGPFINHEMNRCIACYRCVRFYRDFAGGDDLEVFGAHDSVYFGRKEDGVLESPFAGNLVEVCPTGVFSDKTLMKKYVRKWDLLSAPSVCHHCSLGCNTLVGTRYGETRCIFNRYNRQVNGYFLCDRGRFGYEFISSPKRVLYPSVDNDVAEKGEAIERAAALIRKGRVIGIGSSRASLEANYALRTLVGEENLYSGMAQTEHDIAKRIVEILMTGPVRSASLNDVENADAVLVLGEDLTNTAPMLDYAVRQASRVRPAESATKLKIPLWNDAAVREVIHNDRGPVYLATPAPCKLDSIARGTKWLAPDDIARFGFAIAHAIDPKAPDIPAIPKDMVALAKEAAKALKEANRPIIIAGSSLRNTAVVEAAANIAWALHGDGVKAELAFVVSECNSIGAALAGGRRINEALAAVDRGDVDTVIVLENDLYRRAEYSLVDQFMHTAKKVIAIDHLQHRTTARADIVLPAATYAEGDGTLINNEGRAQRFFQPVPAQAGMQESWRWLRDIMAALERREAAQWSSLDDIARAAFISLPSIGIEIHPAPSSEYRVAAQKLPRAPHRYSGRTAEQADITVHEPKPPVDPDSPMTFSMEGYRGKPPDKALVPFFWSPGWNSVQATMRYQENVGGPLRGGDPGVRLLEPKPDARPGYAKDVPKAFTPRSGEWLAVPLYHVFGSEEMSAQAEGIATLIPQPYVAISDADALQNDYRDGDSVILTIGNIERELPVRVTDGLPTGVIGIPQGLPGLGMVFGLRQVMLKKGVRRE